MTDRKKALVVGAAGVIGGTLAGHLATLPDWDAVGLSRREGPSPHVAADLFDPAGLRAALAAHPDVTHLFYAAYQDRPSWSELVEPNVTMLRNVLDALAVTAPGLQHVSLMQGYKVYGAHLGPFATPARESDPPHMPPEFNVDQQQLVEERAARDGWAWSAIRPSVVSGFGLGNPMNLGVVLAVYASISKELGVPLRFPGKPGAFDALLELTDAGLLAEATVWAATDPSCANEAFNIANGDLFRWSRMWPVIANAFDLEVAPPLPMSLQDVMADKEQVWDAMVAKHGLVATPYRDVSSWAFGDFVFSWDYDMFADTSKSRRFGFHRYVETERMLLDLIDDLRKRRIIPA
ncbi:SDR family oxidoreductase [Pseudonocardia sp. TRM90224]|uniref:SDR family oxidoreductase n=1 Tax=Pseudonocardia sp. TRM90224 TaxID=2812678 RepID=UPI001E35BD9E|nr:SDR family oxidoreductase [Pseudonocardia sp. TRM90224]